MKRGSLLRAAAVAVLALVGTAAALSGRPCGTLIGSYFPTTPLTKTTTATWVVDGDLTVCPSSVGTASFCTVGANTDADGWNANIGTATTTGGREVPVTNLGGHINDFTTVFGMTITVEVDITVSCEGIDTEDQSQVTVVKTATGITSAVPNHAVNSHNYTLVIPAPEDPEETYLDSYNDPFEPTEARFANPPVIIRGSAEVMGYLKRAENEQRTIVVSVESFPAPANRGESGADLTVYQAVLTVHDVEPKNPPLDPPDEDPPEDDAALAPARPALAALAALALAAVALVFA